MLRFLENMTSNYSSNLTEKSFIGKSCVLGDEKQSINASATVVLLLLSICLLFVSFLSNGFLCFLLARFKHLRTVSNFLVADLAVVNLLHVIVNGPLFLCTVVLLGLDIRGRLWAFSTSITYVYFSFLTLTTMFMMSIDRYLAIRYPYKHKSRKNKTNIIVAMSMKWLLSLVPVLAVFGPLYKIDLGDCQAFEYRVAYTNERRFKIGRYFIGPPCILGSICLYVMARHKLRLNVNGLSVGPSSERTIDQKTGKALNTLLITVTIFCVCYLSSFLISALTIQPFETIMLQQFVFYFFLFIPSAVNPFIYFMRVQSFKVAITQQWHTCFCHTKVAPQARLFKMNNSLGPLVLSAWIHSVKNRKCGRTSDNREADCNGQDVVELRDLSAKHQGRNNLEDI